MLFRLSMMSAVLALSACSQTAPLDTAANNSTAKAMTSEDNKTAPSQYFALNDWKLTLPEHEQSGKRKGKAREINKQQLSQGFISPEWFYYDTARQAMVFKAPNDAPTTPNSKNARSELRAMYADKYNEPANNFVLASHPNAEQYGSIGGHLSATVSVDWVSQSGNPDKTGAYSVVIGQIHASKNEPLKIAYRKLPGHDLGSLYWGYELNPPKAQQKSKLRKDIRANVWGKYNLKAADDAPSDGIALGEKFHYDVEIKGDVMTLTFTKHPGEANAVTKTFRVDLAHGHYQGHEIDQGYGDDWMYFKAGAYNQCNTKASSSACQYRGAESTDYTQVSFYQLDLARF